MSWAAAAVAAAAVAATLCAQSARASGTADLPQNWAGHGRTPAETRFSPLDEINAGNVARLGLAWYFDFDTSHGQEATPLVVDGVMYTTTSWSKVVALDAASGKQLWFYDPHVPGRFQLSACCDTVNRGVAFDAGKVFVGTLDGRLIALDAATGRELWTTQTFDQSKPYTITGAPRVARGKVYIGNGGAEYGVRGYVSAYDEKDGRLKWRFYTVPGRPGTRDGAASDGPLESLARSTWSGDEYWKFGGGGTVWDSIVYDPDLNQLYIGTGNGGPWNRKLRSAGRGDNLFLSSVLALDPDSGRYLWHYQETPGDSWDFTATQQLILADLTLDGKPRKVLLQAPKNGFFYVIDRRSGRLISADKFMPVNWADRVDLATGRPVENPDARFEGRPFLANSGASGAHNWHPMAFDAGTGLVYIPAQQVPMLYSDDRHFEFRPGLWALGVDLTAAPPPQTAAETKAAEQSQSGQLIAWDPVARKAVWTVSRPTAWNGGVLATGGGLVFQGLKDATFHAYRADTGAPLWQFSSRTPILPGPISYAVNGVQYVAVVAGNGASGTLLPNFEGAKAWPPGRVLAFRLGGTATLPPVTRSVAALNPGSGDWSQARVDAGARTYATTCAGCHSAGTYSEGVFPDLKRSAALADEGLWNRIVIGGVLTDRGMVSFSKYLTASQAEDVRAYVSRQAERAAQTGAGGGHTGVR